MAHTLGSTISQRLKDYGVDVIFGIPGVHNVELYRGIQEAGIEHILARHEQGAGFMADGYSRATGNPGVAFVISGPGVTNIMTAMGQAYSDHVPILVISSCLDETDAKRGQLHQMRDQRAAAETCCAWSIEAKDAPSAVALVDRAMCGFAFGDRRPVHIQVPIKLLGGPAPEMPKIARISKRDQTHILPANVIELLETAKRPLFIFGGGAAQSVDLAREVQNKFGAACFSTYAGRGIIAPDNPLYFGSNLARPSSANIIASADLVVAFGTELAEVDLWRADLGHKAPLVRIDTDAEPLSDGQARQIPILADVAAVLTAMRNVKAPHSAQGWTSTEITKARNAWRAETDAERPGIIEICDALRAAIPRDAIIYSDMTQLAYVAKEIWDMEAPNLWHHPFGFGTLGYALPAAIGGRMALDENRCAIALAGDYGFQYTIQEMGTAAELGRTLPIILWDNGKLKEIEESMIKSQITPNAVIARNPDFEILAQAYGAAFAEPKTLSEIKPVMDKALMHPGPTLIRLTPEISA